MDKTENFLNHAFKEAKGARDTFCPCSDCENKKRKTREVMLRHLCKYGFMPNYTLWVYHGEAYRPREGVVRRRLEALDGDGGVAEWLGDYEDATFAERRTEGEKEDEEEPEPSAKVFLAMLESAQKALHEKTTVSQLDAIGRLLGLKSQHNMTRNCFDDMLAIIGGLLPEGHHLPSNLYQSTRLLRALKMPYEQIHCCPEGCVLFRGEHKDAKYCPKCKSSRYVEVDHGDGKKVQNEGVPMKVLRHLPIIPRLQQLFMKEETAKQMTWHKNGIRYKCDKMIHPADGEAWKRFDAKHHDKAEEARNVRVALATDGFNPYGMMSAPYTCWPVFAIPLNLPPGTIFQRQNIFLTLIIPGHPGDKMGVYMAPVWDELIKAWNEGVCTYDKATKKNFTMYVWYQYSMHDFVAYGIFAGWCVHGKFPCPICKAALEFIWLKKGGKFSSFDKHRQFLPLDHPFREDTENFTKGVTVTDPAPQKMTSAQVHAQIDGLVLPKQDDNPNKGKRKRCDPTKGNAKKRRFVGYGVEHMWTHKSGLERLPYVDDLLLPHYIDVMHTEKNFAEALYGVIMDTEKTKDNPKARVDMATLCDRPKLKMRRSGTSWKKPKADYALDKKHRIEVVQWMKTLSFPDGFAANLRRGANPATGRVLGMKSHDFHIWIERLLPSMVRGYIPEHLWKLLAEVSFFFRQLCAKEISLKVVEELEKTAVELICKLEKVFPPGFFLSMQHLIMHLPNEVRMGGPVQYRWCYVIERLLKTVRQKCGNKGRIEASITEAFIREEVSNFITSYYSDNLPSVHNPLPRYNEDENESTLSLFKGQRGRSSGASKKILTNQEWRKIMLYVLMNLDEVDKYQG
jgi:hypothetical protein